MAHHKLGHAEEAQRWQVKATEWTDKALRGREEGTSVVLWSPRTILKMLKDEVASTLESSPDKS